MNWKCICSIRTSNEMRHNAWLKKKAISNYVFNKIQRRISWALLSQINEITVSLICRNCFSFSFCRFKVSVYFLKENSRNIFIIDIIYPLLLKVRVLIINLFQISWYFVVEQLNSPRRWIAQTISTALSLTESVRN